MFTASELKAIAKGCVALLLLGIVSRLVTPTPPAPPARTFGRSAPATLNKDPAAKRVEIDGILARRGQAIVQSMMKDPDSATFSDVEGRVKRGAWVACGYVNGRNSFGAMAGRQAWVALPADGRAYIESGQDTRRFARNWNRYCVGREDSVDDNIEPAHIALRELKAHKMACGKITDARTLPDGTVQARCGNHTRYRLNYIKETDHYIAYQCDGPNVLPVNRCV